MATRRLQLHRVDPAVPLADQLGALRDLRDAGKIGRIGLSEVTVTDLEHARKIVDIARVQNRYSLVDRSYEPVLDACKAAGITFLPWRPVLGSATGTATEIAEVAADLSATPAQVALAWLLARSPVVLPISGTANLAHLEENVAAADLHLTPAHLALLARVAAPEPSAG